MGAKNFFLGSKIYISLGSHFLQRLIKICSEGTLTFYLIHMIHNGILNLCWAFGGISNTLGQFRSHFYIKIWHVKMAPIMPHFDL